ncbi:efflux RND transporter permease subunit [Paracoccus litorisediminis]|uniref:efflux RND transporter permease subunit n=1 Tax=Paracoccus litorisediminis TaxID=2006130 RepID=UPI0037322F12
MILTRISVLQPVFTTMVMIAVMLFGLISWQSLPIDRYPDVNFPIVAVQTSWSGATPETIESEITDPLEEALASLAGIDEMRSTSSEGRSMVILQFTLETDAAQAALDVRDKVGSVVGQLPDDADAPQVMRFDPTAAPVISLSLSNPDLDRAALTRIAEDIVSPTLSTIEGVGSVTVVGAVDDEVQIDLNPDLLRAYGIGVNEIAQALSADNLAFQAGSLDDGKTVISVQLNSEARDLATLGGIIIRRDTAGPIRLTDLALIRFTSSEPSGISTYDGNEAISLEVVKVEGGNTVELAEKIRAAVAELGMGDRLSGAHLSILADDSISIRNSYETVKATLIEGALLATAIVFLFLNSWRSTVITGFTLPISILGTLAVVSILGFTLNSMTMLALTLSVGILIDDAIVVRENIMRHLHMGKGHRQAALDGTNEIGLAVLATTLSIVAVFLPLAFMDGIVGQFFMSFGVTVSVAVLISLFVSFTLDPMLSSVWHDPQADHDAKRGPVGRAVQSFDRGFESISQVYRKVLTWCLKKRKTTIAAALALFVGSFFLVPLVGSEFVPPADEGKVAVKVKLPVGTSQDMTALKMQQAVALLQGRPEIEGIYGTVAAGTRSGANEGNLQINLVDARARAKSALELVPIYRDILKAIPGATISVSANSGPGSGGSPVTIQVRGRNPEALSRGAAMIAGAIEAVEGTRDITLSIDDTQPIHDFRFLQDAARDLGIDPQGAGNALRTMLAGSEVSSFKREDGVEVPVILRLPEGVRQDVTSLARLPVAAGEGRSVELREVATISEAQSPARIEREDRSRVIKVTANIEGRLLGEVTTEVQASIATLDLPAGVSIGVRGESERMKDTASSLAQALGLAIVCIYLVLASQFGSFVQPVAIMASLPLSLIGVMLGLLAGGSTLNMYSMIGFVMLMGLVVKNAILLVDNANQRVREGALLHEALIEAGSTRFRPIVMTTLAMIFGMLPLALSIHEGSEQSAGMAHAVIGGLISSTILTLVVVPVVLTWIDSGSRWFKRKMRPMPH